MFQDTVTLRIQILVTAAKERATCNWREDKSGSLSKMESASSEDKKDNLKIDKTLIFSTQGCPELQGKLFVCRSWEIEMT